MFFHTSFAARLRSAGGLHGLHVPTFFGMKTDGRDVGWGDKDVTPCDIAAIAACLLSSLSKSLSVSLSNGRFGTANIDSDSDSDSDKTPLPIVITRFVGLLRALGSSNIPVRQDVSSPKTSALNVEMTVSGWRQQPGSRPAFLQV